MHPLDLHNFDVEGRSGWAELTSLVISDMKSPCRSALIRHFGLGRTNEFLIRLAKSLGRIDQERSIPEHPLEDGSVFRVESRGRGIKDARNVILYSTTSSRFPSHTDGSGKREPYDILILHCIRQDAIGGDSILITLDAICAKLEPDIVEMLKAPAFPFPFGLSPIIWEENGELCIRYNAVETSYYSMLNNVTFSEAQKFALKTLATAILDLENSIPRFRLHPGDCLVIDNKRALHGRTALTKGSNRLLKRLRGYWLETQTC